jgi:hypothetical protein
MERGERHDIPLQNMGSREVRAIRKIQQQASQRSYAGARTIRKFPVQPISPCQLFRQRIELTVQNILFIRRSPNKRRGFLLHSNIFLRQLNSDKVINNPACGTRISQGNEPNTRDYLHASEQPCLPLPIDSLVRRSASSMASRRWW